MLRGDLLKTVLLTVDVEPDVDPYSNGTMHGIETGLPPFLEILRQEAIQGDFLIMGSISTRFAPILRRIAADGHCIGSHGWDHNLLKPKPPPVQSAEITRATQEIERASGIRPRVFRAANFSISTEALNILSQQGYVADSSVIPHRVLKSRYLRKTYDYRRVPLQPYHPCETDLRVPGGMPILEIPVAFATDQLGAPLGLGYLNAYGMEQTVGRIREFPGEIVVLLAHPWEMVDLRDLVDNLPEGYTRGCKSNLKPLRDLLRMLAKEARFSTLEEVAGGWTSKGKT